MTAPGGFIDPGPLRTQVETLASALARWACRDDTRAQPDVRRAANTAVETIDVLLRELHRIRGELVDQIRVSDDAAQARVDRLLREYRDGAP